MNDSIESIKDCIESSEGILHNRCSQLRELIFMNEDYNHSYIMQLASDIKLVADIIISQAKKLELEVKNG